ncbi:MAG: homoserine kinase [Alphaproteobacteria bacterium]
MAVYTQVDEEALGKFLSHYDIGAPLSFKGIAEGVENSNYLLETERGRFILTLYEKRVNEADLPFFLGLLEHLAARGLPCPLPVKQKNGSAIAKLERRPAAIVTFLEGMSVSRGTTEHTRAVGGALADLHRLGADYSLRRENAMGLVGWKKLARDIGARANKISPGLGGIIGTEIDYLKERWPKDLPSGVIHADLFPDNVFFLRDKLSGIIDFYFACNDLFALDLVISLNAWCFERKGEFNVTKARAMVSGYQARRTLTPAEIAALPVLARGAALRFLLTRTFDWLEQPVGALVKPKDPLEYLQKLQFHQTAKSAKDYGLDV